MPKNNKAVGYDNIPNEVLKNPCIINVLCHLFQLCFDSGNVPGEWNKAIINPIPKDLSKDNRVPHNYRGISLLCCISKMYSKILNKRMLNYAEDNNILVDEQNGFRKKRSCTDHTFVLNSVIKNRMNEGKPTYAAFIDFQKAFDFVNRDLMFYRLLLYGYKGKLYKSIKSMYLQTYCMVRVNEMLSDCFQTYSGVKQGDCMSTTLFALYINDLANDIKSLNKGVKIKDVNLSILLYADDIVLIAENEQDLQSMLNITHQWCKKWRLSVNDAKSKIMHFRKSRKLRSSYRFHLGSTNLDYVKEYKYLGLVLNEHLNYKETVDILAKAAGRALGSCISKFKTLRNMEYKTYTTIFDTCINPIMNYGSEVWGYKDYPACNNIQMRAMKFFLGVHRYSPNVGVRGDCGWLKPKFERWKNICRYWNRLLNINEDRILFKIFKYDFDICRNNWSSEIKDVLSELGLSHIFENREKCLLNNVDAKLKEINELCWKHESNQYPKLRTYILFKQNFTVEKYLNIGLTRRERSLMAQYRLGVLPLRLETGRYKGEKEEERLCVLCNTGQIENEHHFLFYCPLYNNERNVLFKKAETKCKNFNLQSNNNKLTILMSDLVIQTAKYIHQSFNKRRNILYK